MSRDDSLEEVACTDERLRRHLRWLETVNRELDPACWLCAEILARANDEEPR